MLTEGIQLYPAVSAAAVRVHDDTLAFAFVMLEVEEELTDSMAGAFPEGRGGCIVGACWLWVDEGDEDVTGIVDSELFFCS